MEIHIVYTEIGLSAAGFRMCACAGGRARTSFFGRRSAFSLVQKKQKIAKLFACGALKNAFFYSIKTPKIIIVFACGARKKDVFRSAKPNYAPTCLGA